MIIEYVTEQLALRIWSKMLLLLEDAPDIMKCLKILEQEIQAVMDEQYARYASP